MIAIPGFLLKTKLDCQRQSQYLIRMWSDITKIPNLISLGRLVLLIPAGYFLAQPEPNASYWALLFLILAAVSDMLDGYVARKLNQQTELGLLLDPLSDKIMAGVLAILLIIYRDFPLWLAAIIVGRDILIALGGLLVKDKVKKIPASNLSGKYCFTATAVLLLSYVIKFQFGINLFGFLTLAFVAQSLFFYGRTFYYINKDKPAPVFDDKPQYYIPRRVICFVVEVVYFYKLFIFLGWL